MLHLAAARSSWARRWAGLLLFGVLWAAAGAAAAQTLPVTEREVLTLGFRDDAFPFSYRGPDGRYTGYSVELCQRVVQAIERQRGRPVTVRPFTVTGRNRLAHLLAGNIDLECGSTTNTRARAELGLQFSLVTFVSDVAVLARPDLHDLRVVADLARLQADDPPVVTTAGTTAVRYLPELRQRLGARFEIRHAADHGEAFRMLAEGRASAFVMDRVLLAAWLAAGATTGDGASLKLLDGGVAPEAVEYYGLMMRDTEADQPLKRQVDDTLRGLMQSGEIETIFKRWFHEPIDAPGGVRGRAASRHALGIDMPPALRQLFSQPSDRPFEPPVPK